MYILIIVDLWLLDIYGKIVLKNIIRCGENDVQNYKI